MTTLLVLWSLAWTAGGLGAIARTPGSTYSGRRVAQFVAQVLALHGTTCHLCGREGANSADHVTPRSKGGAVWDLANARPSHKRCNIRRGAQDLDAWFTAHPLPVADPRPLPPTRDW